MKAENARLLAAASTRANREPAAPVKEEGGAEELTALREELAKMRELAEVNAMDAAALRKRLEESAATEAPAKVASPLTFYDHPAKPREAW